MESVVLRGRHSRLRRGGPSVSARKAEATALNLINETQWQHTDGPAGACTELNANVLQRTDTRMESCTLTVADDGVGLDAPACAVRLIGQWCNGLLLQHTQPHTDSDQSTWES